MNIPAMAVLFKLSAARFQQRRAAWQNPYI